MFLLHSHLRAWSYLKHDLAHYELSHLILVWLLIKKIKFKFDFKDKKLLFLLAINILPILLMFLTSVVTGSKIRTMWMTPFYLFFGALLIYLFQAQINIKKLKPFVIGFIFLFFLAPIQIGRARAGPCVLHRPAFFTFLLHPG